MQEYAYPVYLGVWTNWSKGRVLGATLTLNYQEGTLLIAFLAIFVALVGTSLWRISCFFLHLVTSTKGPHARDGLYHQHQAILRNSPDPVHGLVNLSRSYWAWRYASHNAHRRVLPTIAYSAICTGVFALASGFSSGAIKGSNNEVLISNKFCQTPTWTRNDARLQQLYYSSVLESRYKEIAYSRQCYGPNPDSISGTLSCGTFINKNLTMHIDRTAGCPFPHDFCVTNSSNIFLDSGLLDSHFDLGLNSPPADRFLYRTTSHCAPLKTEGRKKDVSGNGTVSTKYFFGKTSSSLNASQYDEWTIQYPKATADLTFGRIKPSYTLG